MEFDGAAYVASQSVAVHWLRGLVGHASGNGPNSRFEPAYAGYSRPSGHTDGAPGSDRASGKSGGKSGDNVVDAEFVDVEDKK